MSAKDSVHNVILLTYQEIIQRIIENYAVQHYPLSDDQVESQIICDIKNNHYLLLYVGWEGEKHIYGCPIHVDIKDNKFWIHRDFTEQGIATQLLEAGVSKDNIVLAFRSPFNRQFTDFAKGYNDSQN
jgi:GNAT superfamily N-acetyltransferase